MDRPAHVMLDNEELSLKSKGKYNLYLSLSFAVKRRPDQTGDRMCFPFLLLSGNAMAASVDPQLMMSALVCWWINSKLRERDTSGNIDQA